MARLTKAQQAEQQAYREKLRAILPPGSTVYTINRQTSRSGMMRHLSFKTVDSEGNLRDITWMVGKALGERVTDADAIRVPGCGMDVGYHMAMQISYAIHGHESVGDEGREAEKRGRLFNPSPGNYRAGYSLNHRWL